MGFRRKARSPSEYLILLIVISIMVSACTDSRDQRARSINQAAPQRLTIFAAASLTEAFTQLGERFKANYPGSDLVFNFAGSQQLAQQLAQGAPADIFASANLDQMETVIEEGLISKDSEQVFAHNRLVVVVYPGAENDVHQLQDLAKPGTVLVLAGEAIPAGKYARQFIARAGQDPSFGPGFEQAVLKNIVSYEENVRAVLSKVILGEADAGIVYISDAAGVPSEQIRVMDIPDNLNVQASYHIAPLLDSRQPVLANEFIAFIVSSEGQQILADFGFIPVRQP